MMPCASRGDRVAVHAGQEAAPGRGPGLIERVRVATSDGGLLPMRWLRAMLLQLSGGVNDAMCFS